MSRRTPVIVYADGLGSARTAPDDVGSLAGVGEFDVLLGWTIESHSWLAAPELQGSTMVAGYALADAVADGRLRYLPVRLSAIPGLVQDLRPDVAVVTGIRRGDRLAFGASVGWGCAAAAAATSVVVEIADDLPDFGGPEIPGDIVATLPRPRPSGPLTLPRAPTDIDLDIGRTVVSILPDRPTLQLGPGGIGEAVAANLDRPAAVWTGVVTEALAGLAARELLVGDITAAYVWGGEAVVELAAAGRLRLVPVEISHDVAALSRIDRFVGCNTALEIGLDGSVNVERVGRRTVAGMGGHPDFCAGATRSRGGMSVIALRSTLKNGCSTIVPQVAVVSTPRCDVDIVVTEHGVADLRGLDEAERAARLISIAAPQHRVPLRSRWTDGPAT